MDELKQYMQDNKSEIKEEKPLFGDEERFFMKLDASRASMEEQSTGRIHFQSSMKRRKIPFWRIIAVPLAATFLVFFTIGIYFKSLDSQSDELNKIYVEYCTEVAALSDEIYTMSDSEIDRDAKATTIDNITFEAIPLVSQLPSELSEREKVKIMKDYYSQKLDGIRRLKTLVSESMIETE